MATDGSINQGTLNLLVQVSAIVIGWLVVHRLSAARDRDKARREMISAAADGLSETVTQLLMDATKYHTQERDHQLEQQIKMSLQDLSIRTTSLYQISSNKSELAACRSSILAMKKAISSQHFEDEQTGALSIADNQVQSIAAEAMKVKQCFLRLKHSQYPAE